MKVDKSFFNVGQNDRLNVAFVTGYDENGNILEADTAGLENYGELAPTPLYFRGCLWKCVGYNYAYAIQQFRNLSNPDFGHYSITPTFDFESEETGTRIPFYGYFDDLSINNYTFNFNSNPPSVGYDINPNTLDTIWIGPSYNLPVFHGLPSWSLDSAVVGNRFFTFEQFQGDNTGNYYDNGVLLTAPTLYALIKTPGWWRSGGFRSPAIWEGSTNLSGDCDNGIGWAVDQMNLPIGNMDEKQNNVPHIYSHFPNHHNSIPDLICHSGTGGGAFGDLPQGLWDCLYEQGYYEELIEWIEEGRDWEDVYQIAAAAAACTGGYGASNDGEILTDEFVSDLEHFSLIRVNPNGNTPVINVLRSDLFDDDGAFTSQSNDVVVPGLYELRFKLKGHVPVYLTFETSMPLSANIPLSTFVDATIFPVPLIDDFSYNINLDASATTSFKYELLDVGGGHIHSQHFELPAGHSEDHTIRSATLIPDGILINRFTFEDGSSFTITTTK